MDEQTKQLIAQLQTMSPDDLLLYDDLKTTIRQWTAIDHLPEKTSEQKSLKLAFKSKLAPHYDKLQNGPQPPHLGQGAWNPFYQPKPDEVTARRASLAAELKKK